MTRWRDVAELVERARARHVFAVSFVLLLALHARSLFEPPYWDALLGAFPQAHWLATHGLSIGELLRHGGRYDEGGACVYPFSVVPPLIALFEIAGVSARASFACLHVLMLASAALTVAGTWMLARAALGAGLAPFVAGALFAWPPFQALAAQINMDAPLSAATVLALAWYVEGRSGAASLAALAALLVKPTGVLVAGALGLASFATAMRAPAGARAELSAVIAYVALGFAFVAELAIAKAFGVMPPSVGLLTGLAPLFTSRLWTLPDFAVLFAASLAFVPFAAAGFLRGASRRADLAAACFVLVFVAFYASYANVLPRYFLQAMPMALVCAARLALVLGASPRGVATAAALFALLGAVNARGALYPTKGADWSDPRDGSALVAADGWVIERSLEYRDDQALLRAIAVRASRFDRERTIFVASWPVEHALSVPRFGYVDAALRTSCAGPSLALAERSVPYSELYALDGESWRRRVPESVVWILVPNVFSGEAGRPIAGDEVVDVVACGRLRAFFVRRTAWE